jgi:hypothetical protein
MERKRSNLAVSVDVTTAAEVLEVVRRVGKSVCMVKVSAGRVGIPHEYTSNLFGSPAWLIKADALRYHNRLQPGIRRRAVEISR